MRKNSGPTDHNPTESLPQEGEPDPDPLTSIEDLHREVQEWSSEHDAWLEDINQWRCDQRLVKLLLYKMERTLPDQNDSLDEHTRIIRDHKQRVGAYEKNIQNLLAGGRPYHGQHTALLKEHSLQKNLHLQERERHDSFRLSHLAAMSELTRLTHALEQAERR